ncbi:hypothetical protein ADUPG1_002781, partial [Aduncisulcus paluster]
SVVHTSDSSSVLLSTFDSDPLNSPSILTFIYVPSESHCSLSVVPFDDLSSIVPSSSKNMSIISSNVIVDGVTVDASSSSTATVSVSVFPPVPLPSHSAAIQSTSDPA